MSAKCADIFALTVKTIFYRKQKGRGVVNEINVFQNRMLLSPVAALKFFRRSI